jgi:hypothetical protein
MRGAQNLYYFGVLEYVVMIEIDSAPKECPWGATTQMKSFYDAIIIDHNNFCVLYESILINKRTRNPVESIRFFGK